MSSPDRRGPLKAHWTPRYLVDRARLEVWERRHPHDPWLTADAVDFLGQWVQPGDRCLEWGSGRSTAWLASRGVDVATVEHDEAWAATVRATDHGPGGVELVYAAEDDEEAYVGAHPALDAIDLALVDGIHRAGCALRSVDLLRPGGLLVIDNVERYLTSSSRSPEALGAGTPAPAWAQFAAATQGWRRYWTTTGVTDTAFWIKPPS